MLVADILQEHPEAEVQTSKENGKLLLCRSCEKPLIANTFYAPANACCKACKAVGGANGGHGEVALPKPGATDPAKAQNLKDCLINPAFGTAICPAHPDDEEHAMVLKAVSHSERYGPSELVAKAGKPEYRQLATGETVMHQCSKCKAVVSYTTTVQMQLGYQNDKSGMKHANGWVTWLGAQEPAPQVRP